MPVVVYYLGVVGGWVGGGGGGVGVESVLMENEIFRTVIGSFHANLIRGPQVTHSEFAETLHICSNK